ncbi:MAG TPA: NAD-dependent epimerase/dehydratase family protein, partial [Coxiellaceae bacterium]|nr:NAD-dependent epimerase/dehydratase family protein [Coxiellaceae bacterium]
MTILVVGGAGYIGSHMVRYLLDNNFSVAVLDNFSTGHRDAIPAHIPLLEIDLLNAEALEASFAKMPKITAVMHFAARNLVGESIRDPEAYYQSNLIGTLNLLAAMRRYNISSLIFSSTAAIYGNPKITPIPVNHSTEPLNPYGRSKSMIETILRDYATTYDFKIVSLRYFNAAGADIKNNLGERHYPETHLIPLMLEAIKT